MTLAESDWVPDDARQAGLDTASLVVMAPVIADRSSRHRVLKWLQHPDPSTTSRSPTVAEDCVVRVDSPAVSQPAGDTSPWPVKPAASSLKLAPGGAAAAAPATPRQRLGQLWKRCEWGRGLHPWALEVLLAGLGESNGVLWVMPGIPELSGSGTKLVGSCLAFYTLNPQWDD